MQIEINRCQFSENHLKHAQHGAGGAVYVANGMVVISNTVWANNSVESLLAQGGALYSAAGALSFVDCIFQVILLSFLFK